MSAKSAATWTVLIGAALGTVVANVAAWGLKKLSTAVQP